MTEIEGYPLSPQQKRAWLAQRDGSPLFTVSARRISGPLDLVRLRESLNLVAARHEVLGCRFVTPPGRRFPFQTPLDRSGIDWRIAETQVEDKTEIDDLLKAFIREPAWNGESPPLTAIIVQHEQESRSLVLRVPIFLCDEKSLALIERHAWETYAALGEGRRVETEAVQYAQYTDWLEELEQEDEGGKAFWLDREREANWENADVKSFQPDWIVLDTTSFDSRALGPEPDLFWWACWASVLARHHDSSVITLATGLSGRSFEELDEACGHFVRFPPLTADVAGHRPFSKIIDELGAVLTEAEEWQEFYDLDPGQNTRTTPFAFHHEDVYAIEAPSGLILENRQSHMWTEPFLFRLRVIRTGAGTRLTIYFDASKSDPGEVRQLGRRLIVFAGAAAGRVHGQVGSFPVLTESERESLIHVWNGSRHEASPFKPVHQQFEDNVLNSPGKTALVFAPPDQPPTRLSFEELDRRANRLADIMRARGVGPETSVALCFGRSPEVIAAILAVLKTGGAYVPMDPHFPAQRIAFILRDSGAALLLTLSDVMAPKHIVPVIHVDRDLEQERVPEPLPIQPEQTAYVIYTSGSTGTPKAVAVEHRQLAHYLDGIRDRLDLEEVTSYAMVSTLAADLGHTVLFPALCFGGTLHLIDQKRIGDPALFADYFHEHKIDCLKITPSHLSSLMQPGRTGYALPRKRLILGGEAASAELIGRVREQAPDLTVFNHYGPTETTVGVLTFRYPEVADPEPMPLGRPIPGTRVYLLNAQLQPVPAGVPGEIHIGGWSVSRGYRGLPAMTAARFVPDPYSPEPGGRIYRSGDRARINASGDIVFLGRTDDQVKIRGYRVELGEVETALAEHPDIGRAVVVIRNEALTAFVTPAKDYVPDMAELRFHLSEKLPVYMIPAVFTALEKIPLTPNGKVDRAALPEPGLASRAPAPPRTPAEMALAGIWESLLGRTGIGVHDHFFEMGGHSLLMVRMMSEIESRFGKKYPIAAVYHHPTVAALAELIGRNTNNEFQIVVPINPSGDQAPLYCVHPIGGQVHWFFSLSRALDGDRPFYGIQSPGLADASLLQNNVQAIAETYTTAIREHIGDRTVPIAGWSAGGAIAFETACNLAGSGQIPPVLVLIDAINDRSLHVHDPETQMAQALSFIREFSDQFDQTEWTHRLQSVQPDEWVTLIQQQLLQKNGAQTGVEREHLERLFQVFQAHRHALEHYRPSVYMGRTVLIRARETVETFAARLGQYGASFGWQPFCRETVEVHDLDTSHQGMMTGDAVSELADLIRDILDSD